MEGGKSAAASAKETAANIAASAKSGLEKTKAVIGEKVEKMTTSDPVEKDMATMKKEDKVMQAELNKQEAYSQNAAASVGGTESYTASSNTTGYPTVHGTHQKPAMPAHGTTGQPTGYVTEDVVGSHYPVGTTASVVGSQQPVGANTGPDP